MDTLVEVELKDALAAHGCALCRIGEHTANRYLRFILHESVNDLAVRNRLLAAWGFCRRHAWHFLRLESVTMRGDGLGTGIIAEGLVEAVQEVLAAELLRRPAPLGLAKRDRRRRLQKVREALQPKTECPACFQQKEHEAYAVSVLMKILDDAAWQERLSSSDGLCFPHFRLALAEAEAAGRVDWLVADHGRRLQALLADLKEYIRKHDYRFVGEPPGRERDAFARAIAYLAGGWFELPGAAPAEAGQGK
jgi:hypothetical protein